MSSPILTTMPDSLKRVALEMAHAPDSKVLFPWLVDRLVEGCETATAAAIWERDRDGTRATSPNEGECPPGDDCLRLVALAARPARAAAPTSNPDLERAIRRIPFSVLDSPTRPGRIEALPRGDSRRWVPVRLVHRATVVGAMGLLLPAANDPRVTETPELVAGQRATEMPELVADQRATEMLELIANQLAAAIANDRALDEIRRLKERLDQSQSLPRPAPGTPVVSEAELRRFERSNIVAALDATNGRVYGRRGAAELLGLKPTTLASRLKKLGLTTRS